MSRLEAIKKAHKAVLVAAALETSEDSNNNQDVESLENPNLSMDERLALDY